MVRAALTAAVWERTLRGRKPRKELVGDPVREMTPQPVVPTVIDIPEPPSPVEWERWRVTLGGVPVTFSVHPNSDDSVITTARDHARADFGPVVDSWTVDRVEPLNAAAEDMASTRDVS